MYLLLLLPSKYHQTLKKIKLAAMAMSLYWSAKFHCVKNKHVMLRRSNTVCRLSDCVGIKKKVQFKALISNTSGRNM